MPTYVCDTCEKAFDSKERLREHQESHGGGGVTWNPMEPVVRWKDFLLGLTLRQLAVLIGVVLMATLFAGTAFFYSTLSPGGTPQGPVNVEETNPPTGQGVRTVGDLPEVEQSELPSGYVSQQPLSHDVQVHLLYRGGPSGQPAVLLQYSCAFCPGLVENLTRVAQNYQGWVYVAPYRDMNASVAVTAPQRQPMLLDRFDQRQIANQVCVWLQNQPIACAVGSGGGMSGNGTGNGSG